jgi:hypothetical protein
VSSVKRSFLAATLAAALIGFAPAAAAEDITELVPGTAVLLNQSSETSSGGGQQKSTSSTTNIFSPAAYVDYKRFGGEPTATVDRYPFLPGQFGSTTTQFRDITYQSAPQGTVFPRYSNFWKSQDLAQTFRVPFHTPFTARLNFIGSGGGDSYQVVGERTHKVFFVDLPLTCVTMNVSRDLGENWTFDEFGCGINFADDRQWVEADEDAGPLPCPPAALPSSDCGNVYVSAINIENPALPTLMATRSTHGAAPGSFIADSTCNTATFANQGVPPPAPGEPANDEAATFCPDPSDPYLWVAGPVVANRWDGSPTEHHLYIPFIRRVSQPVGTGLVVLDWALYIAKSVDGGTTWTRHLVHDFNEPNVNPANIFPQLAIDRAGNLYYTWSETQRGVATDAPAFGGETDVHYAFSTNGGATWSPPINLTKEHGDSAVFPWMVAGDAGRVDVAFYKSNTGLNPNVAALDENGNPCVPLLPLISLAPCERPNPSVWNVFFGQSMNALNTGPNFKAVQISAQPNHLGQVCTSGVACTPFGNRSLLDFIAFDVDHLGAAVVAYTDDNNRLGFPRDRTTRQIAGVSVFKSQTITLQSSWPVRDHAVTDRARDVFDGLGAAKNSCPGMDILAASTKRSGDLLTVNMTLNAPPTRANATACALPGVATGGIWGVEFWAASSQGSNNFYVGFRDNALDPDSPRVEAGTMERLNLTITSLEFQPQEVGGTFGGSCFADPAPTPCTFTMTVSLAPLGITPGNGLYSLTGLSTYILTSGSPLLLFEGGNSEQADATAAIHYSGSGTP